MAHWHQSFFPGDEYLHEFEAFLPGVAWSDRCPLNTEMLFLWSMIRATKPLLFIESGTFRGYSAVFICEALRRNANGAEFVTYGFDLDDCLKHARQLLASYPFARVVEGDSRELMRELPRESRPTAFFIDGPKGKNLPPLLELIDRKFTDVLFVAVHDCEAEGTSGNRTRITRHFGDRYQIGYCDASFQAARAHLDTPMIGRSELVDWKPFHWNGARRASYGTETGYVIPISRKTWWPGLRLPRAVRRLVGSKRRSV